jgi:malonate transporter
MHAGSAVALALLPDFALILLGAGLRRALHLGDHFWNGLEKLVYYVLFPALLFSGLVKTRIDWTAAGPMLGVVAGATGPGMLLGLGARLLPISPVAFASQYQCAFRFNSYIGLAVAGTLFGVPGIAAMGIAIGLMVPPVNTSRQFGRWRVTASPASGANSRGIPDLATLAGIAANLGGFEPPTGLLDILGRLAQAAIVLGCSPWAPACAWPGPTARRTMPPPPTCSR